MLRYMNMKMAIPGALLGILVCSLSTIADAATLNGYIPQRVVKYGDLDLTRRAGAVELYARIDAAAGDVCDPPDIGPLKFLMTEIRRCKKQAIARAIADVNEPTLTEYYLARTGEVFDADGRQVRRRAAPSNGSAQ